MHEKYTARAQPKHTYQGGQRGLHSDRYLGRETLQQHLGGLLDVSEYLCLGKAPHTVWCCLFGINVFLSEWVGGGHVVGG